MNLPHHSDNPTFLDRLLRWTLYALLVFMPLAFGAVDGWSETIVVLLCGVLAVGLALRCVLQGRDGALRTWAMVPLVAFVLLVALQLLPLPRGFVGTISPSTGQIKTDLLSDLPNADALLRQMTLSFYPHATRHALRIVLCASAVFCTVLTLFRRSRDMRRLMGVIAAIGAGVGLLALLQDATAARQIYWFVERENFIARAGTFINRNNFSQFMNLSIGCALGLMLALMAEGRHETEWALKPRVGMSRTIVQIRWLAGAIVIMAASIFISQSRGGMVSLLAAGSVTGILMGLSRRVPGRGWIMVPIALMLLISLMVAGLDKVAGRLATLHEAQEAAGARVQIIRDVWAGLIPKFPLLGVGLGTHEWVYPLVSRQTFANLAGHVENEYVQVLEEVGGIGLALMFAFLAIVLAAWIRSIRKLAKPIQSAAFGLGFGLIAVLIHSNSDFGQRLPAVACLSAVTCGLLINLSRKSGKKGNRGGAEEKRSAQRDSSTNSTSPRSPLPLRTSAVAFAVLIFCTFTWALIGATRWMMAETQWARTVQLEKFLTRENWIGNNDDYIELLLTAKSATEWQSDDVEYRHWLNVYRWYTVVRPDPATGRIIMDEQARAWARTIADEFNAARALCPTFGPAYCMAGQIELFVLDDPKGKAHIRRGFELAPYSPEACYVAAALDVKQGRADQSLPKAQRALLFSRNPDALLALYLGEANRPDLAQKLVEGNANGMLKLADRLAKDDRHRDLAVDIRLRAKAMIEQQAAEADAPAGTLAAMAHTSFEAGDFAAAEKWYARAISLEYANVDWHLARAKSLMALNRNDEAMREAQVCLRLRPYMPAAKAIVEQLSIKTTTRP